MNDNMYALPMCGLHWTIIATQYCICRSVALLFREWSCVMLRDSCGFQTSCQYSAENWLDVILVSTDIQMTPRLWYFLSIILKFPRLSEVIHLGQCLNEDIYKFSANKCLEDFNRQCNMVFANFKYANLYVRNVLFHKYCTAFMVVKYFHCLTIVWIMFTFHEE